jgi:hypothetical protein
MQTPATMNEATNPFNGLDTLSLDNRRSFGRYRLPISLLAEASWNGRQLPLLHSPDYENISATGASLVLAHEPVPPVDAEVHVSFPLVDRPFQPGRIFARCRGRVVRREERNRVAVFFEDVDFIRDERASGIPDAVFAIA